MKIIIEFIINMFTAFSLFLSFVFGVYKYPYRYSDMIFFLDDDSFMKFILTDKSMKINSSKVKISIIDDCGCIYFNKNKGKIMSIVNNSDIFFDSTSLIKSINNGDIIFLRNSPRLGFISISLKDGYIEFKDGSRYILDDKITRKEDIEYIRVKKYQQPKEEEEND